MRTIRTTIDIDATTDVAWQVLTAFDAYAEWNPFMRSVGGEATVGARLTVELAPPGGRHMTIRPTVTAVEPGRFLEWIGRLGLPGLFDGRHRFELEPLPNGRTRLTHGETFRGLLVPLLWRPVHGPTASGFERFNAAFAERCRSAGASVAGRSDALRSGIDERRTGPTSRRSPDRRLRFPGGARQLLPPLRYARVPPPVRRS